MLTTSRDAKTTPLMLTKPVPNSFGLPSGASCPGATVLCRKVCYANRAERRRTEVARAMDRNLAALQACGDDVETMATLLRNVVQTSVSAMHRHDVPLIFRIHWDGDFFSLAYAQAWATVIAEHPDVQFWAYTRSFDAVPTLAELPNLQLYLSADAFNFGAALDVATRFPQVRLAVMAINFRGAEALHRATNRPAAVRCPENAKRLPLTVTGRDGKRKGACAACGLCLRGARDVLFATTRK